MSVKAAITWALLLGLLVGLSGGYVASRIEKGVELKMDTSRLAYLTAKNETTVAKAQLVGLANPLIGLSVIFVLALGAALSAYLLAKARVY